MFFGAVLYAVVWSLIALFIRLYPETIAGFNTMPKHKREKIDIEEIGRLVANVMWVGVPFELLSALMPSKGLYLLLLCWIPCGMLLLAAIYINVRKEKFNKR